MSDTAVLCHTAIAIIGVVVLILRARVNPAIALVLGAIYLGLITGLGPEKTLTTIGTGFGDLMAEVGLLIAFGVLLGSMMSSLGAIEKLVRLLVRTFGPKALPYTFAVTIGTVMQSIFADALLVITAPLARRLASRVGAAGAARMAAAMALGIEVGLTFVLPGVGAVALAGVLNVPFGKMFLFGLVTATVTITATLFVFTALAKRGFWKPELDENHDFAEIDAAAEQEQTAPTRALPPLGLSLSPLLLALALIAFGAIAEMAGIGGPVVEFFGNPVVALLIGLLGAVLIARWKLTREENEAAFKRGFHESGQILILTGVGGSLAATVQAAGLGEILEGYFASSTVAPLLLVWVVAATLHIAIGSVTISAITAAGVLSPIIPALGIDPVFVALAAGAGSLFIVHATSNTFWLLQTLLGQTTRGTLKSCTFAVSCASVIAIVPIQLMALVF
ncbi:H+/gluconate symporter-like permease [Murinocardiopsis flavida]|uniref:H+/gluconate symporter-like permease n=1 Tax=Murinocardiopsis flavida TaxID=645275 RepID=A0A2P8CXL6_9ACTN|nr:SLC13 family permease [Murinocardiopsis flavida]PSK89677.1 H+/gluconate symporter-like permease [Murinocardiopsis flavida]